MSTRLQIPQPNNLDLLRLLFAITVFVTHLYELSELSALRVAPHFLSYFFLTSGRAVQGFFVISGFLIFLSYERSRSIGEYFGKRLRRLYPGYVTNILMSAAALSLASSLPLSEYLLHPDLRAFLVDNLLFLNAQQWSLPGVFAHNRLTAVNGALWTLQIEVMFYLSVPLVAVVSKRLSALAVLSAVYVLSSSYMSWQMIAGNETAARGFLGALCFFTAGALCSHCFDFISKHRHQLLAISIATFVLHDFINLFVLLPLALAIVVVYAACFIPFVANTSRYGDFSYGVYIYHFPIVQSLVAIKDDWNPLTLFGVAVVAVALAAVLSWNLVEKRFLSRSSHYFQKPREKKPKARRVTTGIVVQASRPFEAPLGGSGLQIALRVGSGGHEGTRLVNREVRKLRGRIAATDVPNWITSRRENRRYYKHNSAQYRAQPRQSAEPKSPL